MIRRIVAVALLGGLLSAEHSVRAADDLIGIDNGNTEQYTAVSNEGSIINTRHNLMQSELKTGVFGSAPGGTNMDAYRNNYGEVCVYCHTPHGANTNAAAPLWNRNIDVTSTTYTTYDKLGTSSIEGTFSAIPGAASLPCLSCHDGRQGVDAIINMPGTGRYNATPSDASGTSGDLYTRWNVVGARSTRHAALRPGSTSNECLSCHQPGDSGNDNAVDFTVFAIGTDLRNDHPIGVTFPTTTGGDTTWNTPGGTKPMGGIKVTKFFDDSPSNGKMDKGDIRLYTTGTDANVTVECASCHDPHGVTGAGGKFNKTFLRKTNSASAVCLTCHAK